MVEPVEIMARGAIERRLAINEGMTKRTLGSEARARAINYALDQHEGIENDWISTAECHVQALTAAGYVIVKASEIEAREAELATLRAEIARLGEALAQAAPDAPPCKESLHTDGRSNPPEIPDSSPGPLSADAVAGCDSTDTARVSGHGGSDGR